MALSWAVLMATVAAVVTVLSGAPRDPFPLDATASRWVADTLKKLTLDEKVGQLIVPSFESNFLSTDSDTYDELARLTHSHRIVGVYDAAKAAS